MGIQITTKFFKSLTKWSRLSQQALAQKLYKAYRTYSKQWIKALKRLDK
jgi:hypothetical protein